MCVWGNLAHGPSTNSAKPPPSRRFPSSPQPAKSRRAKMEELLQVLEDESDLQESVEDVFWALLNTKEFLFNR
jgi:hypothetical protein